MNKYKHSSAVIGPVCALVFFVAGLIYGVLGSTVLVLLGTILVILVLLLISDLFQRRLRAAAVWALLITCIVAILIWFWTLT
jgi:hypothetical protein